MIRSKFDLGFAVSVLSVLWVLGALGLVACGPNTMADHGANASSSLTPGATTDKSTNLRSGTLSWSCTGSDNQVALQLTHKETSVLEETVASYHVIASGVQQSDSTIGSSVFDVVVSPITYLDNQELQLKLSLQDYSDIQSWTVILQADTNSAPTFSPRYFGVMLSDFQSSDGDNLLHPSSELLSCTVQRERT